MQRLVLLLVLLVLTCFLTGREDTSAQTVPAPFISGTVVDETGALLDLAQVELFPQQGASKRYPAPKGVYQIPDNPGKIYSLVFDHPASAGFATYRTLSGYQGNQVINIVLPSPKAVAKNPGYAQQLQFHVQSFAVLVQERDRDSLTEASLKRYQNVLWTQSAILKNVRATNFDGPTGMLIGENYKVLDAVGSKDADFKLKFGHFKD